MVEAWLMDSSDEDQRKPHRRSPNVNVPLSDLEKIGVLYKSMDPNNYAEELEVICKERKYANRDEITCTPEKLPNYEEKIKSFFEEHIHDEEEIRFCLGGSGYFDIRDPKENWIRIFVEAGDLIILPAGSYHRFTLDDKDYIHAMRLFQENPKWTPFNRGAETDSMEVRKQYVDGTLSKVEGLSYL
mmetsp:Transcript_45767/g.118298  ORF Transcript_45767/g.118298 Transcript_45767/m.118298 type:complete len:186 (+) Transcript_45767:70-627(+)